MAFLMLLYIYAAFDTTLAAPGPVTSEELQALAALEVTLTSGTSADASDIAKIERFYQDFLERSPKDPDLVAQYGRFQSSTGRGAAAVETLQRATSLAPNRPELWMQLSTAALANASTLEATKACGRALDLSPKDGMIRYHYAHLLYLFRRDIVPALFPTEAVALKEALRHFRTAAEQARTDGNLWMAYAETFWIVPDADWEEAYRAWTEFLKVTDNQEFAHVQLARVAIELQDPKRTITHLSHVRSQSFEPVKSKLQKRAESFLEQKPD